MLGAAWMASEMRARPIAIPEYPADGAKGIVIDTNTGKAEWVEFTTIDETQANIRRAIKNAESMPPEIRQQVLKELRSLQERLEAIAEQEPDR